LTWVRVRQGAAAGLWLQLNPRTGRDVFQGKGEPGVQRALQEHIRPGMNFYDVGANIGFFSLLAARLVGEKGRVTAFEADPEIASRLREHVARNSFSWVTVEEKAVWSGSGTAIFERSDPRVSPDRGLGHVVKVTSPRTVEIQAVSLDEYAATAGAPDFIKCDVEGAEVEVFRGARRILQEKGPGILCELHGEENRRTLLEEFSRLGYVCEPCDETHILALPEPLPQHTGKN
jgi:FkbM family methyltransferase